MTKAQKERIKRAAKNDLTMAAIINGLAGAKKHGREKPYDIALHIRTQLRELGFTITYKGGEERLMKDGYVDGHLKAALDAYNGTPPPKRYGYTAISKTGAPFVTLLAINPDEAHDLIYKALDQNPSRRPYLQKWQRDGYHIKGENGNVTYRDQYGKRVYKSTDDTGHIKPGQFTKTEIDIVVFAINTKGGDQHPGATKENLEFYKRAFAIDCLEKAMPILNDSGVVLANRAIDELKRQGG